MALVFYVNGKKVVEVNPDPEWTVLYYLRNKLRLTGTKLGCSEGGCGACTVVVSRRVKGQTRHESVNACLMPLCSAHGLAITTVEGIGSTKTRLHPVQERLAKSHGSQCGFCTPGIVMAMYAVLRNNPHPSMEEVEMGLQGNLCRCTGYRPIIQGFSSFTKPTLGGCGLKNCCQLTNSGKSLLEKQQQSPQEQIIEEAADRSRTDRLERRNGFRVNGSDESAGDSGGGSAEASSDSSSESEATTDSPKGSSGRFSDSFDGSESSDNTSVDVSSNDSMFGESTKPSISSSKRLIQERTSLSLIDESSFAPYDPTQEPIFPPELQLNESFTKDSLKFQGPRVTWFRPVSLHELLILKRNFPDARLVGGNTEVGIEVKMKTCLYKVLICPTAVPELNHVTWNGPQLSVGAAVTLTELEKVCQDAIQQRPESQVRVLAEILEMLRWFAGRQIRNVAMIGGNVMTGSPISDLIPLLMAAGSRITLAFVNSTGEVSTREVSFDESFYPSYRRAAVSPEEVLTRIDIPLSNEDEYFKGFKQAHRREDDIAIVNAGMRVRMKAESAEVQGMSLVFGGMGPTAVRARKTETILEGRLWEDDDLHMVCTTLLEDLPLSPGVPGGMSRYRQSLALSFFFKFFVGVRQWRHKQYPLLIAPPSPRSTSVLLPPYHRSPLKAFQMYQLVPEDQPAPDPLGRPILHSSALKQTTGEALYCDDIPKYSDELYAAFVYSSKAKAEISSIDDSEALHMSGVYGFWSAKDLTEEQNISGHTTFDEEVFASRRVSCVGQIIGVVVACDQKTAQEAARKVRVEYCNAEVPIITIEDAIKKESFFTTNQIESGDITVGFGQSDLVVEGELRIGGQEHFYLETHANLVVPKEDGGMEVFSSSQAPTATQMLVARALGVDASKVVCRVKRLGGGFGGKETRCTYFTVPVAVAASRLQRPVRIMLDRNEDMAASGTRHPFLARYKAGVTTEGYLRSLQVELYSNAGWCLDLSASVMDRALFHIDNVYHIPNAKVVGRTCRTNLPSNTAFRGFGGPQGLLVTETVIDHVSRALHMDATQVRQKNLYQEGHLTHFDQPLINCTIRRCWKEVIHKSGLEAGRREEVSRFNRENRWRKRGLAVIPTKFGIAFTYATLNQAGALVLIYKDGSVLISHAGVEMGQGLHTKVIQVASRVLGIPASKIHINETATDKVPNTSPTAASVGSDLNGKCVEEACRTLLERLRPYMTPDGCWEDWVMSAYQDRISLAVSSFYKTPQLQINPATNKGTPFSYFSYGAAVSEVEVDCLTGDTTILRTDIVMDVGESLNPAIDVGQIEGAFIQGVGLFVLEQLKHSPEGVLLTRGPGAYKIPGFGDIPVEFNVSLLRGAPNPRAVFSSKAVGEPPLFLASSVFFAIKDAVYDARKEGELTPGQDYFRLDSPATPEKVRLACPDQFLRQIPDPVPGTYKPWMVNA